MLLESFRRQLLFNKIRIKDTFALFNQNRGEKKHVTTPQQQITVPPILGSLYGLYAQGTQSAKHHSHKSPH